MWLKRLIVFLNLNFIKLKWNSLKKRALTFRVIKSEGLRNQNDIRLIGWIEQKIVIVWIWAWKL